MNPDLDELTRRAAERQAVARAEFRVILELLKGGCMVLGSRVELTFPDGQPFGKSNAELAELFGGDS